MLAGLFTTAALVAIYDRLRRTDAAFALFALLLGIAGALARSEIMKRRREECL